SMLLTRPSRAPELLAPDSIMPVQWGRNLRTTQPERRLCIAVLYSAVIDFKQLPRTNALYWYAYDWLLGADAELSFADACAAVGFAPDAVRRHLGLPPAVAARKECYDPHQRARQARRAQRARALYAAA